MTTDPDLSAPPPLGRDFGRFWCARILSSMAFQMQGVAVGWQVYDLTGSAVDLGLVGLAQFLPQLCLTLVVGHVADRYDRRRVVALCQALQAASAALLLAGTLAGAIDRLWLFGLIALTGAARAFEAPTISALLPNLVAPAALSRALALSTSANQTAFILGPALGGLLYALGGGWTYGVATALFAGASLLVLSLRTRQAQRPREPATLRSVLSGLSFIWSRPAIFGAISLDLFSVLLGGATALLPVFARDILHTGPWGLGLLRTAPAVGALAMSIWLGRRPIRRRAGHLMFAGVGVFGCATIVFGLSRSLPLSLAALVIMGAGDVISVVVRSALVQGRTPDAMRGRVSAVNSLFIGTSNQLGEFESGMTAALFGTVPAVVIGGVGTLLVAGLWMRLFPALRQVDRLDVGDEAEKQEEKTPAAL